MVVLILGHTLANDLVAVKFGLSVLVLGLLHGFGVDLLFLGVGDFVVVAHAGAQS